MMRNYYYTIVDYKLFDRRFRRGCIPAPSTRGSRLRRVWDGRAEVFCRRDQGRKSLPCCVQAPSCQSKCSERGHGVVFSGGGGW